MVKKCLALFPLILILSSLYSNQLIHFYFKDYHEVTRLVFVFDQSVFYNVKMDTDSKLINIELTNCQKNLSMLPVLINQDNPLIENIFINQTKKNTNIQIRTKTNYYGESFQTHYDRFKLVIDVYRQEEPTSLSQAQKFLEFYETVAYTDKAIALKKRILNKDFGENSDLNQNTNIQSQNSETANNTTPNPALQPDKTDLQLAEEFLNLTAPILNPKQLNYNWIKTAYDIHAELKQMLKTELNSARIDLASYKKADKVDIHFLEVLSQQHNLIAKFPIKLNEIKVKTQDQLATTPKNKSKDVLGALDMLNKLQVYLPVYQKQVQDTIQDYQSVLSQK